MDGGLDGEQAQDQGERSRAQRDRQPRHTAAVRPAQRAASARPALRLRSRAVWSVLGALGRQGDPLVRDACCRRQRQGDHDARGPAGPVRVVARHGCCGSGCVASAAAGVDRRAGAALRLLPERNDDPGRGSPRDHEAPDRGADPHRDERPPVPLWHLSAHPDGDPEGRCCDGQGRQVTMTEVFERQHSRKTFLKGGGAMVVGFSLVGAGLGAKAAKAADDPYASNGPFDAQAIDSWLTIHADNTVTLRPGAVEIGQGTITGLLLVAAEELNVSMSQMRNSVNNDTNTTPVSFYTAGSSGIATGSLPVRAAAAAAKSALLDLAATNLGVAKGSLTVSGGVVSGGGKTVTYGALLGDKLFNVRSATALSLAAGAPGAKAVADYSLVSKHGTPRVDIPAKVNGTFTYVHNIKVPGMIHGRVVRPRGQGAYGGGTAPKVLSVDEGSIKKIAGAQVVRFGDFVGVVAPTEYAAIQASAQLKVKWADMPKIAAVGNVFKQMRDHDSAGKAPARIAASAGNFAGAFANAAVKVSQSYSYHYNGSMPIGPACAVADVTPTGARVFSN